MVQILRKWPFLAKKHQTCTLIQPRSQKALSICFFLQYFSINMVGLHSFSISKKIPALRARSPLETCLELSFRVFPLVSIVDQPKKVRKLKKTPDPDFEGSELREDQSPYAKKLFFIEINHIFTELLQKKPILNVF
jgi:hypothetical protein